MFNLYFKIVTCRLYLFQVTPASSLIDNAYGITSFCLPEKIAHFLLVTSVSVLGKLTSCSSCIIKDPTLLLNDQLNSIIILCI